MENTTETQTAPEPIAKVQGQAFTTLPKDLYIPPDAMEVFLEAFEGPLDLLLYLIRDALHLEPGNQVEFNINQEGQIVLQKISKRLFKKNINDRFEAARGKADIKWRTDDLMALLRDESE